MSGGIPRTLAVLRKEVGELREVADAESEAIAAILFKIDEISRCLSVVAKQVKHLHGAMATRNMRDAPRINRR